MPPGQDDVVIGLQMDLSSLRQKIAAARKLINEGFGGKGMKKQLAEYEVQAKRVGKSISGNVGGSLGLPANFADNFTNVNKEVRNFGNELKPADKQLTRVANTVTNRLGKQ